MTNTQIQVVLRPPIATDGASVFKLVKQCPPLDVNSMYCNLLQCSHFAGTSVSAFIQQEVQSETAKDQQDELVGFISAYLIPERQNTLFIWQAAVAEKARGQGLASRMAQHILARPLCHQINWLETTITKSNRASWALFEGLAHKLGGELNSSIMFDKQTHLNNEHDTEFLVRIGPLSK